MLKRKIGGVTISRIVEMKMSGLMFMIQDATPEMRGYSTGHWPLKKSGAGSLWAMEAGGIG